MNRKSMQISGTVVALIIVVLVILFSVPFVSKLEAAMKGYAPLVGVDNGKTNSGPSGKLSIMTVKSGDNSDLKPDQDHCFVRGTAKNDGSKSWTAEDKIKIKLFCKYDKNQLKDVVSIDTYPALDKYISDLQPGQQIEFIFPRSPNTCTKSSDTYSVILYSNCIGQGNQGNPCDNTLTDNPPMEIDKVQFSCN